MVLDSSAGLAGPAGAARPAGDPYARFVAAVAGCQVRSWLPAQPSLVLDLSIGDAEWLRDLADLGHRVVRVIDAAEVVNLRWLASASFDAVIAEGGRLSSVLATESAVEEIARVLRPGGRVLLSVDSMLTGLAQLAGQARWAELADVPLADVVIVPTADGSWRRCFSPDDLTALLTDAGLAVEWVRSRTILAEPAVEQALAADGSRLRSLVETELELWQSARSTGQGATIMASAARPTSTTSMHVDGRHSRTTRHL